VDIVLRTRALFYYNINDLPEAQKAEFSRRKSRPCPPCRAALAAWVGWTSRACLHTVFGAGFTLL
jgi:hypothetical protein